MIITSSRPVVFIMKSLTFETNLVLATLNPDTDTQSQSTISGRHAISALKRALVRRAPVKQFAKPTQKTTKSTKNTNRLGNNSIITTTSIPKQRSMKQVQESLIQNSEPSSKAGALLESLRFRNKGAGSFSIKDSGTPQSSYFTTTVNPSPGENTIKPSIFASPIKRKSDDMPEKSYLIDNAEDVVPNSPPKQPSKKARTVFQRCVQMTFDPRVIPGYTDVEVEDSSDDSP